MIGTYKKNLKTGFPNGKRVEVVITQSPDFVLIDSDRVFDFLDTAPEFKSKGGVLNKINFSFSNGQFHLKCSYKQYPSVLTEFTQYIEEMIFAGMLEVEKREAKDDNKNSSNSSSPNGGRTEGSDSFGNNGGNKKKGLKSTISSVLAGSRGSKQSPNSGGESESKNSMATKGD